MGKKRAISIRRLAEKLVANFPDQFSEEYEENQQLVSTLINFPSKPLRNKVAGYITRMEKRKSSETLSTIPLASAGSKFLRRKGRRRRRG